jgi:nitrogen fixation NifU-like protein
MEELRNLYQEVIVDHSRRPRNFRAIADPSATAEGYNPLCGDKVTLYLKLDGDRIRDVAFQGSGCAISTASASLLTEALKGKTTEQAQALFDSFHQLLTGSGPAGKELGKLAVLAGVREYPMRVKCATLAWHTLRAALKGERRPVSTE